MDNRIRLDDAVKAYLLDDNNLPDDIEVDGVKYIPVKAIGSGYKGVVWRIQDPYGRPRALKLSTYADYQDRSFRQEMYRALKLEQHQEFARFLAADVVELSLGELGSHSFVAMVQEWIEGQTLRQFLQNEREKVTGSFFLAYVRGMCNALNILETAELTHDDLHFDNVMLANPPPGSLSQEVTIKVIDSGSLKPGPTKKEKSDQRQFVEHLVEIWNVLHARRLKVARERRFLNETEKLLSSMVSDEVGIGLTAPSQIKRQFEIAWTRANSPEAAGAAGAVPRMNSPFEFPSAEHIADDTLLVQIFAESCPWLE